MTPLPPIVTSMPMRLHHVLFLLCSLLLARGASAQTTVTPEVAAKTRAIKVGLCAQWLPSNPFGGSSSAGPGVVGVYEFLLSPRFSLGIVGGYVSYDAGLTAGADVQAFVPLFLEVAFHVSHLSAIDAQSRSASYFEVLSGTRWSW